MFSNLFSENRAGYEIMSKNMVEPERRQTVWRMRVACWINKATRAQAQASTQGLNQPSRDAHTTTQSNTKQHNMFLLFYL